MNCPKSAKDNWQLWKLVQQLTPDEIRILIRKRKKDLKYESNPEQIKKLRTDISILNDACMIATRKEN